MAKTRVRGHIRKVHGKHVRVKAHMKKIVQRKWHGKVYGIDIEAQTPVAIHNVAKDKRRMALPAGNRYKKKNGKWAFWYRETRSNRSDKRKYL